MPDTFETLVNETIAERTAAAEDPESTELEEPTGPEDETAPQPEDGTDGDEPEEPDGDAEDSDEDDDGDDTEDEPQPVTVADETVLVLSDGTTLTGKELHEGNLRHADYTRKTQELAEQRREVDGKIDDLAGSIEDNPTGWIEEIVSSAPDPTATLAQALVALAKADKLDPEFIKTFGIDTGSIAEQASTSATEDRIARLERERAEEREQADQDTARQSALDAYRRQYAEIVSGEGLTFESAERETQFKAQLAAFAGEHKITDLRVAYDALTRRDERQRKATSAPEVGREASEQVKRRKQQAAAITPSGGSARQPKRATSFDEAAQEAVASLTRKGRLSA